MKNNETCDVTLYFLNEDIRKEHRVFNRCIDGVNYYFKTGSFLYKELLASEIYRLLEVPCVQQNLIKIKDTFFLISKDYKKDGYIYKNGYELYDEYIKGLDDKSIQKLGIDPIKDKFNKSTLYPYNSLETVWSMLEYNKVSQKDIRQIMKTLIKYYSLSIILLDYDFHPGNWEIEFSSNYAEIMPKFDNEQIFCPKSSIPSFFVDPTNTNNNFIESLEYFLSLSDYDDRSIFKELYYACNEELINTAINNLNQKYGNMIEELLNKQEYENSLGIDLRRFSSNRDEIYNLIKNMELMGR